MNLTVIILLPTVGRVNRSRSSVYSSSMEYFRSFLRVIGLLEDEKVDFISELPLEVSLLILRQLDPQSLLCAAQVSSKWLYVCRADKSLRQTARHHVQRATRVIKDRFSGTAVGDSNTLLHKDLPTPALVRRCVPFVGTKTGAVRRISRNTVHSLEKSNSVTSSRSKCIRL